MPQDLRQTLLSRSYASESQEQHSREASEIASDAGTLSDAAHSSLPSTRTGQSELDRIYDSTGDSATSSV